MTSQLLGVERGVYLELYRHLSDHPGDLIFRIGEDDGNRNEVHAHYLVVSRFCEDLPFIEEGGRKVVMVRDEELDLPPSLESLKHFIKAIYLGKLNVPSFSTLCDVRYLATLYKSADVSRQCDQHEAQPAELTEKNYHVGLEEWPEGSQVHQAALDFTIKNLKYLVNNNKTLCWSVVSWKSVLQHWKAHPIVEMPLSKEELYESVRSWREMEENAVGERDDAFVEMIKLMDASFLYETVVPNALLTDRLIVQLASHYYNQEKLQKQNGTCSCTHELRKSSRGSSQPTNGQGTSTFCDSRSNEPEPVPPPPRNKRKRSLPAKAIDNPLLSASGSKRMALGGGEPELRGVQIGRERKRKEVSNYKELVKVLKTVQPGDHILLKEGKFFGQLSLTLPDNVTISGMGESTIVTARNKVFAWDITTANGKNCVIENLHFLKSVANSIDHRKPTSENRGLWTSGSDLSVRNCTFTHCCLGIETCTNSTFENLSFDSSYLGVILTAEASDIIIKDAVFKKVATGISCWAQRVTMTNLTMTNVDAGVVIQPDLNAEGESGNDNKVSNLTYNFNPEETSVHQIAAEIFACKNNNLKKIKCLGYSPINVPGIDRLGLRISNHDKDKRFVASENVVERVRGAPISFFGKANILTNIRNDCPWIDVGGRNHEFINVLVDQNRIVIGPNASVKATKTQLH